MSARHITWVVNFYRPVPAVQGGALQTLTEELLRQNETQPHFTSTVYSVDSAQAQEQSRAFRSAEFVYLPKPAHNLTFWWQEFWNRIRRSQFKSGELSAVIHDMKAHPERVGDVIIAEGCPLWVMELRKHFPQKVIVAHLHDASIPPRSNYYAPLVRSVNEIWTCSEYTTQVMRDEGRCPVPVNTLLNGIADRFFESRNDAPELRKQWGIAHDEKVVLFAGRLMAQKGVRELLQAIEKSPAPQLTCMILGGPRTASEKPTSFERAIRQMASRMHKKVIFTGFIHNTQLPSYFQMADLCVIPSTFQEPFGLVAVEALASGTPVIATRVGGLPEVLTDACALFVETGPQLVPALSNAITQLATDDALRKRLSSRTKEQAQHFTISRMFARLVELLGNINT